MSEDNLSFPDDLSQMKRSETDLKEGEWSETEDAQGKCGGWKTAAATHSGTVKDCNNITPAEAKKIGDVAISACKLLMHRDCAAHGCKVTQVQTPVFTYSCSNYRMTVMVAIKYFCAE